MPKPKIRKASLLAISIAFIKEMSKVDNNNNICDIS
jgi:hypothetical protein